MDIKAEIIEGKLKGKNIEIQIGKTPCESKIYIEGKRIYKVEKVFITIDAKEQVCRVDLKIPVL